MTKPWIFVPLVAVFAVVPAAAAPAPGAAESKPALVVRVQPLDRLLADVRHLLGRFDDADSYRKFEATLLDPLGPRGLAGSGLDPRRPWGGYALLRADWTESAGVLVLPVADKRAVLGLLERLGFHALPVGDGLFTFTPSDEWGPAYLRFAFGYAYVTVQDRSVLTLNRLVPPGRLFPPDDTATATAVLNFDQIPASLRDQARAELAELQVDVDAADDADDVDFGEQLERHNWLALFRWARLLADNSRQLTASARFDRPSGELRFEAALSGRDGSLLSAALATLPRSRSLFAPLTERDAAFNLHVVTPLPAEHRTALARSVAKNPESTLDALDLTFDNAKAQSRAAKVVRALLPTLRAGRLDFALSLRGPVADRFGIVAGLRVKRGDRVDRAVRRLIAAFSESDRAHVTLDAERVGSVAVHRLTFGPDDGPGSEWTKNVFGGQPAYWAVSKDAILVAFGQGGLGAIREALPRLHPRPVPALRCEASTRLLQAFIDRCTEHGPVHLQKLFGTGLERVRFLGATWAAGPQLSLRAAVNVQALVGLALGLDADDDEAGVVPPAEPNPPAQPPARLPPGPPPAPVPRS